MVVSGPSGSMVDSDTLPLSLTGTGLALVVVATAPALAAAISQLRHRTPKDHFYEDEDGKSTPESIAAFSNRLPKTSILAFSTIGFGTWLAISVLSTLESSSKLLENWLIAGAWVSGLDLVIPMIALVTLSTGPRTSSRNLSECPSLACKSPQPRTVSVGVWPCCCRSYCTPIDHRGPACVQRQHPSCCHPPCRKRGCCPLPMPLQRSAPPATRGLLQRPQG